MDASTAQPAGGAPTRVLVVEDEAAQARLTASYLEREGFAVQVVADGLLALDRARVWQPDVVVLDLGLPGLDGVEVCRTLRTFSDAYVVMVTARVDEVDRLIGLAVGADDYLTKPFSPRELVARVQAMLRRPRAVTTMRPAADASTAHDVREIGVLRMDLTARDVQVDGRPVELTRTEFDVLATLVSHPGRAWSRTQLTSEVWGADWVGDPHLVDVHLANVRRKLGDDASTPRFVQTVRGFGYRLGACR
ncbi:response regulator transcription factor [Actinotalea sp. M2MS4P-6]|uniref:response regulator transcription factor n=1 Tax=Actinotalea sp. M2MS4P-6 TaxID=2983762 RepID=UPI0021E3DD44|nr:response regulator transcription factor [Actinotalea sp. M2MS4P-6]MCV2395721.1 response regulator transcription factor [Actinotalea sp. M2MS4P-6]